MQVRRAAKQALALLRHVDRAPLTGATLLIYHRVGGGTGDELDLPAQAFADQLDALDAGGHDVVPLDTALDRLDGGDRQPSVVLTFDDGFADVGETVLPILRAARAALHGLPGCRTRRRGHGMGRVRVGQPGGAPALTWSQVEELSDSGLCTIGNHTHSHATPLSMSVDELDRCSHEIERRLGAPPSHFVWTWGVEVDHLLPAVRQRFRSAATGTVGRNQPGDDLHRLRRVPVRATDPPAFFRAKLQGTLQGERAYGAAVRIAKRGRRGLPE